MSYLHAKLRVMTFSFAFVLPLGQKEFNKSLRDMCTSALPLLFLFPFIILVLLENSLDVH